MCGKRCTIECSAKEPASAPRKGGGTANFGVDMPLASIHAHKGPTWDASVWLGKLRERIIDHHAGAAKPSSTVSVGRSRHTCLKSANNRNVFYRGVATGRHFVMQIDEISQNG